MDKENYKYLMYLFMGLFAYSVYSHINTGKDYTATCNALLTALNEDEARMPNVLGSSLGQKCLNRMSY